MVIHWYYIKYRKPLQQQPLNDFINPYIRTSFAILLFSYSMITTMCFEYLTCVQAGLNKVVFTAPSIRCTDDKYHRWKSLIILLVIFPVIGLPILFAILLFYYRKAIALYDPMTQSINPQSTPEEKTIVSRLGILFDNYRQKRYYWEVLALSRRTLVIGLGNALVGLPAIRYQILVVLNVVILLLQVFYRPFLPRHVGRKHNGNYVETFALSSLVLLSIFTSDTGDNLLFQEVTVSLIAFVSVFVLIFLVARETLYQVKKSTMMRKIANSISSPELPREAIGGPEGVMLDEYSRKYLEAGSTSMDGQESLHPLKQPMSPSTPSQFDLPTHQRHHDDDHKLTNDETNNYYNSNGTGNEGEGQINEGEGQIPSLASAMDETSQEQEQQSL